VVLFPVGRSFLTNEKKGSSRLYGNKENGPAVYVDGTRPRAAQATSGSFDPAPLVPEKYNRAEARKIERQNQGVEELWLGR
jgi:hypothetical protein